MQRGFCEFCRLKGTLAAAGVIAGFVATVIAGSGAGSGALSTTTGGVVVLSPGPSPDVSLMVF